jgi:DNA-binding CsgD family transcriptional regulator
VRRSTKKFNFTPRERDVAGLVAKGQARKTIAADLKISTHTLDDYLLKIRQKTGTKSTFEAGCLLSPYF